MKNLEIERKFLLYPCSIKSFLKNQKLAYSVIKIKQFYVLENMRFIRYREVNNTFIKTIKEGEGVVRREYEEVISKEEFLEALEKKEGNIIKKRRYIVNLNNKKFEFDAFRGYLKGLNFLEVEFDSIKEANSFQIPKNIKKIIIDEVSTILHFTNKALALVDSLPTIKNRCNLEDFHPYCDIKDLIKATFSSLIKEVEFNREKILANDKDIERLHQFRVNLRKIRAILKLFSFALEEKFAISLQKRLSKIMKSSNEARDIDVYLQKLPTYKKALPKELSGSLDNLERYLLEKKLKARETLKGSLESKLYKKTIKELKEFTQKSNIGFKKDFKRPTIVMAKDILPRKYKTFIKKGEKLTQSSSSKKYHKLRIRAKELRYGLEFFALILEPKSYKKLEIKLKNIQNILGDYHDLSIEQEKLKEFLKLKSMQNKNSQKALKLLIKNMKREQKSSKEAFIKEFKNFKKSKKYLKKAICRF